jgi:hypothetical protein
VDLKRPLGLALCAVAVALIAGGLVLAFKPHAPPAKPRPVTITIDGSGAVRVREGSPSSAESHGARDAADPRPAPKR